MTEYQTKQFDSIRKVCMTDNLFLRQNKKGDFYSSSNDNEWGHHPVIIMIRAGFDNRDIQDILTNNPEDVLDWLEWVFRENKR